MSKVIADNTSREELLGCVLGCLTDTKVGMRMHLCTIGGFWENQTGTADVPLTVGSYLEMQSADGQGGMNV